MVVVDRTNVGDRLDQVTLPTWIVDYQVHFYELIIVPWSINYAGNSLFWFRNVLLDLVVLSLERVLA